MSPASGSRVIVTGVGGSPGFDLAVSMLKRGIEVIGLDASPLAPGLLIPGIIPRVTASADGPGYPAELLGLCAALRPAALFSTVEHELPALIRMRHDLAGLGVRTWLPDLDGARACLDKAAFCAALVRDGLPVPRTWLPHEISRVPDGVPLVVKPRYGQGSKGVYFCSERRQAAVLCELAPDPVIQEHVPGREFTADCLADRDGRASVIMRWRLLVKGGLSVVSATFGDEETAGLVRRVLAAIGAAGPCCVQGIVRDDGIGPRVQFIEANARFAGAFRLSEEAGADLVGQALAGMFGAPVDHAALAYRLGIYLTKYTETLAAGPPPRRTARGASGRRGRSRHVDRLTVELPEGQDGISRNALPYLHGCEADAVKRVLASGHYTHGPETELFERELGSFLGVPDVVAVSFGTAALHIALLAAGIGPGDEVVVPSFTFCATVQAVLACGATPRFADTDPATLCVTAGDLLEAVTPATRAVMPVLYGGRAVDLTGIAPELADRGIIVIEDAAHAFGSFSGKRRVGATGGLTCFSFDPIKNLTCGEGGALVPRGPAEAERARRIRDLGITQSRDQRTAAVSYTVETFGLRAHLPAVNAAIGRAQLACFAETAERRQRLWRAYREALGGLDGVTLVDVDVDRTVPFNCVVRIAARRDEAFTRLRAQGVGVGVHYPPNHVQPAFAAWHRRLPRTELVGRQVLSLPFHPALGPGDAGRVAGLLREALR